MDSLKGLLKCLHCPFTDEIDFNARKHIITLVGWLEDTKIRQLHVNDRDNLRTDSGEWNNNYKNYLIQLECPIEYNNDNVLECTAWLISNAIAVEYEDICEDNSNLGNHVLENLNNQECLMHVSSHNDELLVTEINNLGNLVKIIRNNSETDIDYLKRITHYIKYHLSPGSIQSKANIQYNINDFTLGFDTRDELVNKIGIVLKMLHYSDLRELQNDLNALLVLGQEYTANPKTNTALGKVGR